MAKAEIVLFNYGVRLAERSLRAVNGELTDDDKANWQMTPEETAAMSQVGIEKGLDWVQRGGESRFEHSAAPS